MNTEDGTFDIEILPAFELDKGEEQDARTCNEAIEYFVGDKPNNICGYYSCCTLKKTAITITICLNQDITATGKCSESICRKLGSIAGSPRTY